MALVQSSSWEQGIKERLVARDAGALTELYDQFGSYVFGLAARVIGDRRAAEDVTQDVFLWLWEHPQVFEPSRGRLRTFLGTLSHRRAIDHVRREEARRRRSRRDAMGVLPVPDVDELATALVTAEQVRAEVERLPFEQRQAIELAYFGGRTYREVAEELGIEEGTAKSRMRLGLRRIAEALRKLDPGDEIRLVDDTNPRPAKTQRERLRDEPATGRRRSEGAVKATGNRSDQAWT